MECETNMGKGGKRKKEINENRQSLTIDYYELITAYFHDRRH